MQFLIKEIEDKFSFLEKYGFSISFPPPDVIKRHKELGLM